MKPRLACLQMGQRVRLTIGRDGPSQATAELREIEEKREICVDGRERLVIRKNKEREREVKRKTKEKGCQEVVGCHHHQEAKREDGKMLVGKLCRWGACPNLPTVTPESGMWINMFASFHIWSRPRQKRETKKCTILRSK